ncbi:MAG: cytochrome c family protein [Bradyrhizobium sp.]|uniref:c-type cytochrome n=1 Tax=Bradyrhizobium sp. TaxID=376 RepID=UPI001C299D19|nr:cytochrome c family protein [Bradyrhizobium sp.]MBU6464812.1 cytochrome c family protein [Pseudomonadota bacterium]MDE2069547.1 cytochrome c family protein [Bradyrhizobium sp.]MDE2471730.1 cytochrome c family protein [Bradyrhizobium sp.]
MHSNRTNAVLGFVLGTLLFVQTIRIVDAMFLPGHEKPASEVKKAGDEQSAGAAGAGGFNAALASASAERGKQTAKQCEICHNVEEGKGAKIGPDLYGVVGRPVASEPGFNYSAPLKAKGGKWTFDALNKWLTDPRADVPGTMMTFAGISSEKKRADVIAYLNTLSKNPEPLPK